MITSYWLFGRVDLRDLPRAVGVVERGLDLVHRQAERRHAVAIDVDLDLRVVEAQIAVDVFDAGDLLDLRLEQRRRRDRAPPCRCPAA